jgi:hypothetical protein
MADDQEDHPTLSPATQAAMKLRFGARLDDKQPGAQRADGSVGDRNPIADLVADLRTRE